MSPRAECLSPESSGARHAIVPRQAHAAILSCFICSTCVLRTWSSALIIVWKSAQRTRRRGRSSMSLLALPLGIALLIAQNPIIATLAGTGQPGYSGDGAKAAQARLNAPFDVAFDSGGNLYLSDTFNHCIRRIDAATGLISTVAGNGTKGFSGDGGLATRAQLNEPYGLAIDRD